MPASQRSRETNYAGGTHRAYKGSSEGEGGGAVTVLSAAGAGPALRAGLYAVGGASAVSEGRDPTRRAGPGSQLRFLRW